MARELVAAVGAKPLELSPEHQDTLVAWISHLPYVAAVALVRAAQAAGDEQVWDVAASGFRDTSRLAASDLRMMVDILLTNRAAVQKALAAYRAEFDGLASLIERGDADTLHAALAQAQRQRAGMFRK